MTAVDNCCDAGQRGRRVGCCSSAGGSGGKKVARGIVGILHTAIRRPVLPGDLLMFEV